jgi:hypothetical protein
MNRFVVPIPTEVLPEAKCARVGRMFFSNFFHNFYELVCRSNSQFTIYGSKFKNSQFSCLEFSTAEPCSQSVREILDGLTTENW